MRTILFAVLGLIAVGCAAPAAEEELGESTQNLNARDLPTFQPYKTVGGTCEGCRAYVDSLEITDDGIHGGRKGTYKIRHCPINATTGAATPERECDTPVQGEYFVRAMIDGDGQRKFVIDLTPAGGGAVTTLTIDDSAPGGIPTLKGADASYFGKGHPTLTAGAAASTM